MEEKSNLYLATNGFPWGKGEKTFIMPELPYLLEKFDVTVIAKVSNEGRHFHHRQADRRLFLPG